MDHFWFICFRSIVCDVKKCVLNLILNLKSRPVSGGRHKSLVRLASSQPVSRQRSNKDTMDTAFQKRWKKLNSELEDENLTSEEIAAHIGRHSRAGHRSVRAIKRIRKSGEL